MRPPLMRKADAADDRCEARIATKRVPTGIAIEPHEPMRTVGHRPIEPVQRLVGLAERRVHERCGVRCNVLVEREAIETRTATSRSASA